MRMTFDYYIVALPLALLASLSILVLIIGVSGSSFSPAAKAVNGLISLAGIQLLGMWILVWFWPRKADPPPGATLPAQK